MTSRAAVNGIGERATGFLAPMGGFQNNPNDRSYRAGALQNDGSFAFPDFDPRVRNAQYALQNTQAFGAPLPQGMGMMAGILPAALKIEEHKKMQEIAEKYYEKYIKDFNKKYGFTDEQITSLVEEFNEVTEEICRLIPDEEMKNMYRKYIESYPTMYLSMIPQEALQTKLAVKCVAENTNLRKKVEAMSSCVSSLVRNLTDLQISAGIPPIVNLMFESMPDPLTAITDPMYHQYNDSIVVYHKLLSDERIDTRINRVVGANGQPQPNNVNPANYVGLRGPQRVNGHTNAELLRLEPVQTLTELVRIAGDPAMPNMDANGALGAPAVSNTIVVGQEPNGDNIEVSVAEVENLKKVMQNMQSQTGCQPFGDEWNHMGPTPAMNPAMCLSDGDKFQAGNPRHEIGRTNMYQAKRDSQGNAQWVPVGDVPALSGGAQQLVTPRAPGWDGVSHMPGVDSRPPMPQRRQTQMQMQMPQQQPPPTGFGSQQAYAQPYEVVREYEPTARKTRKSSKSKKKKSSRRSS